MSQEQHRKHPTRDVRCAGPIVFAPVLLVPVLTYEVQASFAAKFRFLLLLELRRYDDCFLVLVSVAFLVVLRYLLHLSSKLGVGFLAPYWAVDSVFGVEVDFVLVVGVDFVLVVVVEVELALVVVVEVDSGLLAGLDSGLLAELDFVLVVVEEVPE